MDNKFSKPESLEELLRADFSKSNEFYKNFKGTVFDKMSDSIDDATREILKSLQEQINLSKAESKSARKEALFSKVVSIVSLVVAAISAAATVMALLEVI